MQTTIRESLARTVSMIGAGAVGALVASLLKLNTEASIPLLVNIFLIIMLVGSTIFFVRWIILIEPDQLKQTINEVDDKTEQINMKIDKNNDGPGYSCTRTQKLATWILIILLALVALILTIIYFSSEYNMKFFED
jgi:hypothetical protein